MQYHVRLIGQDEQPLPRGREWMLIEFDGHTTLFIDREAAGRSDVLEEAWAAYRLLDDRELIGA